MPIRFKTLLACLSLLTLVACNQEQDDLAKAQDCLDKVSDDNPTAATECLQYVEKYTSQQANILKCGIHMTAGGLIESKLVKAYEALKKSSLGNKSAAFMTILSLDLPNVDQAFDRAKSADVFCQSAGIPGLQYLSSVVLSGTAMNYTIKQLTGNGIDVSNPSSVDSAVQNMLTNCTGDPLPAACETALPTLGSAAISLSSNYCDSSSADQDVCSGINKSADETGGDPTKAGQALLCYLKKSTYNPATNTCL